MTPSRFPISALLVLSVIGVFACARQDRPSVRVVDLVRALDRAEARPGPAAFQVAEFTAAGVSKPSILTMAPSRLVFTLPFPRRATFHTAVAADAAAGADIRVRVGVSDDRIYESLAQAALPAGSPGWTEIHADLSAYAGWKWSVFYRPDRMSWRLVLSTDLIGGPPARVAWGVPTIDADVDAARAYEKRPDALRPGAH